MSNMPIKMPPGIFRNGTRYQAKGRWYSANRVRWYNGAMQPIGGWEVRKDANGVDMAGITDADEYVRDAYTWRDNNKNQYAVFGTHAKLLWLKEDGTTEDLNDDAGSPIIGEGPAQPIIPSGYGTGVYGAGVYGIDPVSNDVSANDVGRWKFDSWGENLLALPDWDGQLYEWIPGTASNVALVANAPTDIVDFIVTQERIVMTIGGTELRKVQWSDQEDNTNWTDALDNQAGEYTLPGVGRMIGIYKLRNQIIILTETDAWLVRYLGPPYVYGFEKIGDFCAPVHRSSATVLPNGALMWYGKENFWIYDGSVRELPSEIITFLKSDIDVSNSSKIFFWVNPKFREVWMHYPSIRDDPVTSPGQSPAGIECGQYITWSWVDNSWSQGSMERTAAAFAGVFDNPQMISWDGIPYWHERFGVNYDDGVPSEVRSGPIELGDGDRNAVIRSVTPDAQRGNWDDGNVPKGTLYFYFSHRQQPTGTEIKSPTYTHTSDRNQPIPVRVNGRDVMLTLFSSVAENNNWIWGNFRLDVVLGGGR